MNFKPGIFLLTVWFAVIILGCSGAGNLRNVIGSSEDEESYEGQSSGVDVKSDAAAPNESDRLSFSMGGGTGLGIGESPGSPPPPRGGWNNPNDEPYDLTFFENYGVNPFIATEDEDTSTFGMDVDTASYTLTRRFIQDGNPPDPDSVRTEEFINYFHQNYPEPPGGDVFSVTCDGAESRFGQPNYHLLRIGIKARDVSIDDRPPANMIFVVDVSGSMQREDRLEQVKRSLRMLAMNLKPGDGIGLVVYGSTGEVISDITTNHDAIMNAIERLMPGGSTNAGEGLRLAYDMARRNFDADKINRIVLCSDGVANNGITEADAILEQVKADALNGITLTTMGFGMGNYNDVLMEKLANHGDGMYYYIDSDEESSRVFGDGAASMLLVLASDAKIQVEFNSDTVERFRLLGYENRRLNEEDFEDDAVDAGEVGSGQTVTALYEIRIRDEAIDNPGAQVADVSGSFEDAPEDFRFTSAVAEFAEILKHSYWAEGSMLSDVLAVARDSAVNTEQREFCDMVESAVRLEDI